MKNIFFLSLLWISTCCWAQKEEHPNILVIMVDDVAPNSIGAYLNNMQYPTPNIDRIAKEGALFTDHYAHPSCTAGRSAFITGQLPIRTGLTTVGQPGNPLGIKKEDPTLASMLKAEGYMTGQFGKNHLGDLDEHLPTLHGFDEFYGNLYHLNVSEEPEQDDYPKDDPEFIKKFSPRGIIESYADGKGGQRVQDVGDLTKERMKTFDEELVTRSKNFIKKAHDTHKPFFIWHAPSRMHVYTHLKEDSKNLATDISTDMDLFGHGFIEHDTHVGQLLNYLDELGITENTIVIYTTDNGPESSTWPHAGTTMFRGEKMTTWEGGVRAPFLVRWPKKIPKGLILNGISSHEDVVPTLMAAVGNDHIKEDLKTGKTINGQNYRVYLDGYNNLEYWTGKAQESARNHFYYYYESDLTAIRMGPWKMHFATKERYFDDLVKHTTPKLYNLRKDPFERYDDVIGFHTIMMKSWLFQPFLALVREHIASFVDFPPRQEPASLDINEAIKKAQNAHKKK